MVKKDDLMNEKEKKEEELQKDLFDDSTVSDDVSDIEDEVDEQDDYLDLDEELSKVEYEDDDFDETEDSQEDYIDLGNTTYLKPVADENDYLETGVLPELTAESIAKMKKEQEEKAAQKVSDKTVSNTKKKRRKKKAVSDDKTKVIDTISVATAAAVASDGEAVAKSTLDGKKEASKKAESKKETKKPEASKKAEGKKETKKSEVSKKAESKKETKKPEAPKKEKKKVNVPLICGAIVFALLLICGGVYAGFAKYFETHYFYNTSINGRDFSMKTVEDAKAFMEQTVNDYELIIEESDGTTEKISGSDIGIEFTSVEELQKIIDDQNVWKCYECISNTYDYTTSIAVAYDEAKLEEVTSALNCMDKEQQVASKSAYPEFSDEEGKYVIHPEVIGTKLKNEKFMETLSEAILSFADSVNLEENGCYKKPKYTTESSVLKKCVKKLNKYLKAEITYDVYPETEVCDASVIQQWLSYDDSFEVTFDEVAVETYVQDLAYKFNTVGNTRTFTTVDGETATVSGGSYGYSVDKETEYYTLIENIKNGDVITREPSYYQWGVNHSAQDWGDTYAEVNLTTQHMRYIENGSVVMESDVVTGLPRNGHDTPEGVYSITWMQSPSTLKGRNDDGSKYSAKVQYWMAFNYDIGFHDANWQSSFGGQRYLSVGSHGCVNMPTDAAGELYGLVDYGTPVVVHW